MLIRRSAPRSSAIRKPMLRRLSLSYGMRPRIDGNLARNASCSSSVGQTAPTRGHASATGGGGRRLAVDDDDDVGVRVAVAAQVLDITVEEARLEDRRHDDGGAAAHCVR